MPHAGVNGQAMSIPDLSNDFRLVPVGSESEVKVCARFDEDQRQLDERWELLNENASFAVVSIRPTPSLIQMSRQNQRSLKPDVISDLESEMKQTRYE